MTSVPTAAKEVTGWLPVFLHYWPMVVLVLVLLVLVGSLLMLLIRAWDWRLLLRQKYTFIEITPPASADKSPLETKELFTVLHGLGMARSIQDRLVRKRLVMACEVPSTKEEGIRYILGVPSEVAEPVQQAITAHASNVRVRLIDDYLPKGLHYKTVRILEFEQRGGWYLPLKTQDSFNEHDPYAYLTSAMTGLESNEQVVFQLVLQPVEVAEAADVAQRIRRNENMLANAKHGRIPLPLKKLMGLVFKLASEALHFVVDIATSSPQSSTRPDMQRQQQMQADLGLKPARSITPHEQEVNESINQKVHQPQFRVEVRALVVTDNKRRTKLRAKTLQGTIAAFDTNYQKLRARRAFPAFLKGRYRLFTFQRRLPSLFPHHSNVLSASEVADLYHFPAPGTSTESLVQSLNRTLAATLSLKQPGKFDVVIGTNTHHGRITPIGLGAAEREHHMYMLGATGSGKTTTLELAAIQDIRSGKGVGIVDPHGDFAEFVLKHIPEDRVDDVIYFNPDDIDYPIGLNLAEMDPSLTGSALLKQKSQTAEAVIEAFRKVFSDDGTGGHRIESILRNALLTAMTIEGATLFTIQKLLRNAEYRKEIVSKLDDPRLIDFWNEELGKAGGMQYVSMTKGVTTKLDRFESDPVVERILGQAKSTINFNEILDGKILICNFGKIGPDSSRLLGTIILSQIQLAAKARARKKEEDRIPFYLYVDEFQNFATLEFTEMVAEARKYKLFLTMAEQTTSQIEDQRMIGQLLGNVGTIVCFRTGNPADERLLLPFFGDFLKPGEINSQPAYNFYARLASVHSQAPVSGATIKIEDKGSDDIAQRVIAASRANYATEYVPVRPPERAKAPAKPKSITITNPAKEPL